MGSLHKKIRLMLELLKKLWKTLFLAPKKPFSRYSNVFNFPPSCPTFWRFKTHVKNEIIMTSWNDLHKWPIVISGITQKPFFKKATKIARSRVILKIMIWQNFLVLNFKNFWAYLNFEELRLPGGGGGALRSKFTTKMVKTEYLNIFLIILPNSEALNWIENRTENSKHLIENSTEIAINKRSQCTSNVQNQVKNYQCYNIQFKPYATSKMELFMTQKG